MGSENINHLVLNTNTLRLGLPILRLGAGSVAEPRTWTNGTGRLQRHTVISLFSDSIA